ncbi:hypothetical protein, partial [Vibrio crassostreae]|uniref:hypothetical protein n=2 Tax=Vibrio crassostreae TaxID=246167 RepID=UPI001B316F9A
QLSLTTAYKPNTLATALSQKPYKLTAGNINLGIRYPSRVKVIPGQKPVRENRNGLNISILDWVFFGRCLGAKTFLSTQ